MKVLLCHAYYMEADENEKKILKPYPPQGLLYISSHLSSNGIKNEIFDSTFSNQDALFQKIDDAKPEIIGIYTNLMTKVNVIKVLKYIREHHPNAKSVLGGPDLRYNVDSYLQSGADFLVIGEGESSMLELIQTIKNGENNFHEVKGIAFQSDEKIIETDARPLIKDLEELSFPAYDQIDLSKYLKIWKENHGMSMMSISTQRGCPYTCKWCSTAVYGQSYRRKNPAKVVEEIKYLQKNYDVDAFWFVDDVFTVSHKWLEEFNSVLLEKGIKVKYECISRADRMNKKAIQLLKDSGCFRVWIGAESGSQKILDAMDRRVSAEKVQWSIQESKKAGIETGTFIMLGYPGENKQDIDDTIKHLSISDPDHFTITLAYPIKGTDLYNEVESSLIGHHNWENQSDRDRDFKRTYHRKFYKHAIRRVVNEVRFRQSRKHGKIDIDMFKYLLKSKIAHIQMRLNQ